MSKRMNDIPEYASKKGASSGGSFIDFGPVLTVLAFHKVEKCTCAELARRYLAAWPE